MSAFRTVRVSRFRHAYGQPARRENCYEGMRITASAHDSQFCAVNPKFIAVVLEVVGGGAFQVLPIKWTGKVDYHTGRVSGHSGIINDLKWDPFNDNVIATCSDDATIKLWYIPDEGIKSVMTQYLCELVGHSRRVAYVEWHPTVEGVLASAGFDFRVLLWNVSSGECFTAIDHQDIVYSLAFNFNGSLLATTSKDKFLRIIDLRTGQVLQETCCHEGTKASKVVFLSDKRKLLTTGFNRMSHRQYAVWDQNDLSEPLVVNEIDTSAGVLFPFYDPDLSVLYIAGKGDGNIRYYEILADKPYIQSLSEFQSRYPQRGLGFMPKRGLNVAQCEIFRFYKVHTTQWLVEPLSFVVPRRSDCFQSDLYPPTPGPTPALTIDEWLCGIDKDPVRISLRVDFVPVTNKPVQVKMASTFDGQESRPLLITSDRNNERKFQFLSEITKPDYRDITQRDDYPDIIKNEQLRINMSERLRQHRQSGIRSLSSASSGDSPQRISACGVSLEEEDEEKDDAVAVASSVEINNENLASSSSLKPLKLFVASVSPRQASPLSQRSQRSSCSPLVDSSSSPAQQQQSQQANVPNKVRRISQTSARSSPPLPPDLHLDTVSNDSVSSGSLLDRSNACAALPFADQMSLGSLSVGSSSAVAMTTPSRSPVSSVSGVVDATHLPKLLKPQPFHSNGFNSDRKTHGTKPGLIAPGPIVHREHTAHIRPFRVSHSQPPTPRNLNSPSEENKPLLNGKQSEIQKLYAEQSKRLRELLDEVEPKDKRIAQLEQDLAKLTLKVEELQKDTVQKHDDIESLRYEIAWKNKRIAQLEQMLYRKGSGGGDSA